MPTIGSIVCPVCKEIAAVGYSTNEDITTPVVEQHWFRGEDRLRCQMFAVLCPMSGQPARKEY